MERFASVVLLAWTAGSIGCLGEASPPRTDSAPPSTPQSPPPAPADRPAGPPVASIPRTEPPAQPAKTTQAAGLTLPAGFTATLFAVVDGTARHLVVRNNGDVYVRLMRSNDGKATVGLRDTNRDGRADVQQRFGARGQRGTGVTIRDGYLYFSSPTAVYRQKLNPAALVPTAPVETVVSGFPEQGDHGAKPITFDERGRLYVNVGAPSNACQVRPRSPGSPGRRPCDELKRQGGIWRFAAGRTNMKASDGHRFASGTRQIVALEYNPTARALYGVQHGRDQLHGLFGKLYTERDSAELPSEEFLLLTDGFVGGWPYTYYDHLRKARMVAPEYGGDGKTAAESGRYPDPIYAFPGHYAPNDLVFYRGTQFPERYRNGAFIAFHGSWNRAPLPQEGYQVVFVPFRGAHPSGPAEVFADGFKRKVPLDRPGNAAHRPTGLAVGPDGTLYVSDSKGGHVWRIAHPG